MPRFITHARSLSELRDEFLSDLHRRLAALDAQDAYEKRTHAAALIGARKLELEAVLEFWSSVELRGQRKPKEAAQ